MSDASRPAALWTVRPMLKAMMKHHACAVYLYLRSRWNSETGRCDPSVPTIARDLGIDERSVKDAKAMMKRLGVLDWTTAKGNRVNFIFPEPAALGTSDVGTCHVGTCDVGTCHAPTVGTFDAPRVGASHAPQRYTREGNKEDEQEGPSASAATPPASSQAAETPSASPPEQSDSGDEDDIGTALLRLAGYLGYGEPAERLSAQQWKELKPTATNWFHAAFMGGDNEPFDDIDPATATQVHIASFAWYMLNRVRAAHDLPVVKPVGNALMGGKGKPGILGALLKERGPEQTLNLIDIAAHHSHDILASADPKYAPPLDASFFHHKTTVRWVERFMREGGDEMDMLGDGLNLEQYL